MFERHILILAKPPNLGTKRMHAEFQLMCLVLQEDITWLQSFYSSRANEQALAPRSLAQSIDSPSHKAAPVTAATNLLFSNQRVSTSAQQERTPTWEEGSPSADIGCFDRPSKKRRHVTFCALTDSAGKVVESEIHSSASISVRTCQDSSFKKQNSIAIARAEASFEACSAVSNEN